MRRLIVVLVSVVGLLAAFWFVQPRNPPDKQSTDSFKLAVKSPEIPTSAVVQGPQAPDKAAPDKAAADKVVLDPAKQKRIWDAEHVTFEIEHRLGQVLLKAIEAKDLADLTNRCTDTFKGSVPGDITLRERKKLPLTEWTLPAEFPSLDSSAQQTMAKIVALNDRLSEIQRRRLRVLKIAQSSEDPLLWDCRFLVTFSGMDTGGGQRLVESENQVAVRFRDKEELTTQPVIGAWKILAHTERNCTQPLLQEVTNESGLADLPITDNWKLARTESAQYRFQLAVEDFDRDGDPDIAVTTVEGRRHLLVNEPGLKFVDRTRQLGLLEFDRQAGSLKFLAAWLDYDNDGYPDLLSGSQLFHNDAGKQFTDVSAQSGLKFDSETMGATVADFDGDGLLDLYVLYQKPFDDDTANKPRAQWVDETGTGKENELWKNVGRGRFARVTDLANAGGYKRHTHAATWLHYDDDAFPDLYIANDFGRNVLLRNLGNGRFEDVTDGSGAGGFATSMGVCAGDVDNDGTTDIYVANMFSKMGRRIIEMVSEDDYPAGIYDQIKGSCAGNQLYCRNDAPMSPFTEISDDAGVNAVGWAWGPAMFDADNDGLLDLYATTGFLSFDRTKPDG